MAAGVRLYIAPASLREAAVAAHEGLTPALEDAGAQMLPSACGACIGRGRAVLAAGEVGIATTARNFRGRMGHPSSATYLASPYTVAASAVAGCIADPRELL